MSDKRKTLICLILLSTLLSACGEVVTAPRAHLTPCPPENNEYTQQVDPEIIQVYENAISVSNDINAYNVIKQDAFRILINLAYRMSDPIDIRSNNRKTIRITITYISPEFAQAIILNEYLYNNVIGNSGTFASQIQSHLDRIVKRNEYIFFITVLSSEYKRDPGSNNYTTVNIPVQSLRLTNTADIDILSKHYDHNLEELIVLDKPVYGVVSYMMAVENVDSGCQQVLDENFDTRIFLSAPYIKIDGAESKIRPWEFIYTSLIPIQLNQNVRRNELTTVPGLDKCSPNKDALSLVNFETAEYWEALARFIWYEIISDP